MDTKVKMAIPPVRYATKSEYLVGWLKLRDRDNHWLVRGPKGNFVGEIFQVKAGRRFYALVYGRIYPTTSGCVTSNVLDELVSFMTGVALNRRT